MRRAVFVDRDGVINELVSDPRTALPESPLAVADVRLIPGATHALRRMHAAGFVLVGVSNQPAAAKGTVELAELKKIHARVVELLRREQVELDGFRLCFHHPDGVVPELTRVCACRKPAPGMLLEAAAELGVDLQRSWMIGDTDADIAAGAAAGCRTVLVRADGSAHKRSGRVHPDATAQHLAAAADFVVASGTR